MIVIISGVSFSLSSDVVKYSQNINIVFLIGVNWKIQDNPSSIVSKVCDSKFDIPKVNGTH